MMKYSIKVNITISQYHNITISQYHNIAISQSRIVVFVNN